MAGYQGSDHTTSETARGSPGHVKMVFIHPTGGSGRVRLLDGGSSGTVKFRYTISSIEEQTKVVEFPGEGLEFSTDIYVDLTDSTNTQRAEASLVYR